MEVKQDTPLTLKIPFEMKQRVDAYRATLEGFPSRSEVVRILLDKGLDAIERGLEAEKVLDSPNEGG